MKKVFLGLMAASMLVACQSNQTQQSSATTNTAAVSSAPANSLTPTVPANAPVIKFAVESFSFGKIKQGDKVSYDFKFTNTGKSPLIITDATATCGCTTPQWPKEPIQPGGNGVIQVTFNSANKSGLQDKLITVTANTIPPQNMVHLTGEVLTK